MALALNKHVQSIHIRSFSGPYFPAFELSTENYSVNLRIRSECVKIRTKKTSNMEAFYVVSDSRYW